MKERRRSVWSCGVLASLAWMSGVPACSLTHAEETCATYACVNVARLQGEIPEAEDAGGVSVKYCSEVDCVEGNVDLSQVGSEPRCVGAAQERFGSEVCFTRDAAGKLQVDAGLARADDMTLPPDGERYTLTIVDGATGSTLLEESREADYETTREDSCHLCWQAEMSL